MNHTPSPEPSSIFAATCKRGARLADAARSDQRDESMLLDERRDFGDLRFATDERLQLQRQVIREDVERAQRRKALREVRCEQLIDLVRGARDLEADVRRDRAGLPEAEAPPAPDRS